MCLPVKIIADEIQELLGRGVSLFPSVYYEFLEQLMEKERMKKLCLLPSARFELYHMKLERKRRARNTSPRKVA